MVFRATRLAHDGYLLRRAKVDVSKLRPDAVTRLAHAYSTAKTP